MKPAFGITRHVERRYSNETFHGTDDPNVVSKVKTLHQIMVSTLWLFWIPVWTHETEYL